MNHDTRSSLCHRRAAAGALLLAGLAASGCGDGDPESAKITIRTGRPPTLIAFRDEASAAWQPLTIGDASTFEITATGPYRVVIACETETAARLSEYARTLDDDRVIAHTCTPSYPFRVRGHVVQAGEVFLGNFGFGTTGTEWDFELRAAPGSFDLVLLFGDLGVALERIAFRRDVAVAADTQVGVIDLAQETSHPLDPVSFTGTNVSSRERTAAFTTLDTGSTHVRLNGIDQEAGWSAIGVSDGALRATDHQRVSLSAEEAFDATTVQRARGVNRELHVGDQAPVTLPEPLGPITFDASSDQLTATWDRLPKHDEVRLLQQTLSADFRTSVVYQIVSSRRFLDATGATSTTLDLADIPGFKPAWRHDPALLQLQWISASYGTEADGGWADASQQINRPASARATPPRVTWDRGWAPDAR